MSIYEFLSTRTEDELVLYGVIFLIAIYLIMNGLRHIAQIFKQK